MLYRVKVENTTKFNIPEHSTNLNTEIYKLIYDRTNGVCEIEYNPEVRYIFKDIHTGIIHDLSSFTHSYSTLFLKEELESFTQLPVTESSFYQWLLEKAGFKNRSFAELSMQIELKQKENIQNQIKELTNKLESYV